MSCCNGTNVSSPDKPFTTVLGHFDRQDDAGGREMHSKYVRRVLTFRIRYTCRLLGRAPAAAQSPPLGIKAPVLVGGIAARGPAVRQEEWLRVAV
ncbi:hypothetical protein E4U53_004467 [Claviceps sorghi]|nr:hypothetical protein E4U53_004467 [Claviceps sorghi]